MSDYTLYLGDCLEYMRTMEPGSVDAVITDPPYGTGTYETDIDFDCRLLSSWVNNYRSVAIFGFPELMVKWCVRSQTIPDEWITWWPSNKNNGNTNKLPRECEVIGIFGKTPGTHRLFRQRSFHKFSNNITSGRGLDLSVARLGDVWRDASPGMAFNSHLRQHPNEKPISVMTKLIELCSDPGDLIFDPFMGSGTTGVACMQLGRRFIGCEIDPNYYAIAERRIKQAAAQMLLPLEAKV